MVLRNGSVDFSQVECFQVFFQIFRFFKFLDYITFCSLLSKLMSFSKWECWAVNWTIMKYHHPSLNFKVAIRQYKLSTTKPLQDVDDSSATTSGADELSDKVYFH